MAFEQGWTITRAEAARVVLYKSSLKPVRPGSGVHCQL